MKQYLKLFKVFEKKLHTLMELSKVYASMIF